jgi:MiaB-like tRNA modifying enzyme
MEKIYFKTSGCSNNFAESEMMKGIAKTAFLIAKTPDEADVIVLNICTVKGDDSALSLVKKAREQFPYKQLIVAGCIPIHLIKAIRAIAPECALMNTHNLDQINQVIEEVMNNNPIEMMAHTGIIKAGLPRIRKNKVVGIIPVSNSCIGRCTYCSVRPIKGKFYSFPEEKIVDEVKKAVKDGCSEIWLTSQDNGCYGIDTGTNLPELLKKVIAVEGDFYVRLGMMNPNSIKQFIDELIEVYKNKKMFKFIHIPVQSGSNRILKEMGRQYTVEEFTEIVQKFRKIIPEITLSTDIIAGFPGETDEDFEMSAKLVKDILPSALNISKFRKRPGTPAAKLTALPSEKVQNRSRVLHTAFEWATLYVNRKWKGWEGIILIDEEGKDGVLIGRNAYYKPVVIQKGNFNLGDKVKVKVHKFTKHCLYGEIL